MQKTIPFPGRIITKDLCQQPSHSSSFSSSVEALAGGIHTINVDDPLANSLLMNNIARFSVGNSPIELVSIEKITTQVVSGIKYGFMGTFKKNGEFIDCNITIVNRPWVEDPAQRVIIAGSCDGQTLQVN